MTGFDVFKTIGTIATVVRTINALKDSNNSTAEDLFKESCIEAVKQSASNFADITNPAEVDVDSDTLATLLKDIDTSILTSLEENSAITKIAAIFQKCIILPRHQLTEADLKQRLQPVIKKTFAIFLQMLPRNQQATNETMLEYNRIQLANQENLIKDTQVPQTDPNEIKEITQRNLDVNLDIKAQLADFPSRQFDLSISEAVKVAVAAEHKAEIDNAQDLLNKHQPHSALNQLEKLKDRIWEGASAITKFRILTGMGTTQLALKKEQEGAKLILKAFQYNPEDETALSNRALAHFLLRETEMAEEYAKKTLKKNPTNINAYRTLIEISTDEETLEEVIAKVPEYLRNSPQIAYAISNIAKQRGNLKEARKWREIMVEHDQEDLPDYKAALASILIEQISQNRVAALTNQLDDPQQEQLRRAIELLTEAWNCVAHTESRNVCSDWIINRSTAYALLDESKKAMKDLDTFLEIDSSRSDLLRDRAILAYKESEFESALEFWEKILSNPEIPNAPILYAVTLFTEKRFSEAISTLKNFLMTNPSPELQEEANRWLVRIYIDEERFEEAEQISTTMRESSPENILDLIEAARISKATGKHDEALSYLKEAYNYAQNSEEFLEIAELADQLYIHKLFKEASVLYEKIADPNSNSELTQWLLKSYYNAGEIGKALELCRNLREKCESPLENISKIEYEIYEEIGDLNKALAICKAYLSAFPDDTAMQMHLAYVHYRLNNFEEFDHLLDRSFDLKSLSLQSCFNLAYLYQIGSKPEKALEIMYEARRTYCSDEDAHLKYFGLFLHVEKQIGELLHPIQVQSGTAVHLDSSGETRWYIIEKRDDANRMRNELDAKESLAEKLLGKSINDEIVLRETPLGPDTGKITDIQSKYTYAFQEICREFSDRFPEAQDLWSIKLDDSDEIDDSEKFQPVLNLIDKQSEDLRQTAEIYKETPMPIGAFAKLIGRNVLDTWGFLMSEPDLGIRCCIGNPAERNQARALFENGISR